MLRFVARWAQKRKARRLTRPRSGYARNGPPARGCLWPVPAISLRRAPDGCHIRTIHMIESIHSVTFPRIATRATASFVSDSSSMSDRFSTDFAGPSDPGLEKQWPYSKSWIDGKIQATRTSVAARHTVMVSRTDDGEATSYVFGNDNTEIRRLEIQRRKESN